MSTYSKRLSHAFLLLVLVGAAGCSKPAPENSPPENITPATQPGTPPAPVAVDAPAMPAPIPESAPEAAPAPERATTNEAWLIVPGERVGAITATSSEADLIAAYGAENVQDTEFYLGEGETEMGTGLFLEDETKTIRILWEDPEKKLRPVSVELSGNKSVWKTADGISLGTPLTKVQAINGKPFKLYGFEWDYGGTLSDGNQGNIKGLPHEDPEKGFQPVFFSLTFQHDFEAKPDYPQDKYAEVAGDSEFSSDHPVMQDMDPVVYSINLSFPDPAE